VAPATLAGLGRSVMSGSAGILVDSIDLLRDPGPTFPEGHTLGPGGVATVYITSFGVMRSV